MAKIRVLDQNTADKIAAGEVIERPLSVVKELVENALDAGAGRITVDIKDGGTTSITVSDNGCGIEPEDAALAFSRHATSKISRVEDLLSISTLGFRGEALPSIAAVSKVTMLTRVPQRDEGIKLQVEGGNITDQAPAGCPPGTKITVQDLFYNTPARKKHLKRPSAEAGLISDLVARLALSRPDVSFKFTSQNRILLETPGNDKLIDTIAAVNGIQVAKKMIPIEGQGIGIHISGYVSKPELNRATRSYQTILINGRYVKSRVVSDALQEGYHTLLSSKRHPLAVLKIELVPGMVDVNVHPAKMEVRIDKERELYKLIVSAVQRALRTPKIVPVIEQPLKSKHHHSSDAGSAEQTELQLGLQLKTSPPANKWTGEASSPHRQREKSSPKPVQQPVLKDDQESLQVEHASKQMFKEAGESYQQQSFPELLPLGQLLPTYILAQGPKGLYIIDQHAAHERVLYERYTKGNNSGHNSQMLLVPVVLELNYHEAQVLTENILTFRQLGFIIEHFGGRNYMLRGVPMGFPQGEEAKFFYDLLETRSSDFYHLLAAKLACRSAIKSGQKLSHQEMETLLQQMREAENPYTCPHGRPTIINLTFEELAKRFQR
ncbi:DNA mismatch repair protein MutL [Desulfohalotomaculum tongense]|uniref:DNA mismatch repair endonuclease MutL n=1 Tax=Desulforadius tongensis TaxID=1216062 RepID=UPI0019576F99|nr:DNA mismatch repair endonuclease MutL [Desulforadius tongensis]MBM7854143.1 DNA mismatch repair protein MutL [Desulforadius tongensis]